MKTDHLVIVLHRGYIVFRSSETIGSEPLNGETYEKIVFKILERLRPLTWEILKEK